MYCPSSHLRELQRGTNRGQDNSFWREIYVQSSAWQYALKLTDYTAYFDPVSESREERAVRFSHIGNAAPNGISMDERK